MILHRLKHAFTRLTGVEFYRANPPWGTSLPKDIARMYVDFEPRTVFDVGANVGQSVDRFLELFPAAHIHAFEPVAATYAKLQARHGANPSVTCNHLALSRQPGQQEIFLHRLDVINSLEPSETTGGAREVVTLETADRYAGQHGLDRIDLLKIDTEGHDAAVLDGAAGLLDAGRIHFILSEVRFAGAGAPHRAGANHTLFGELLERLEPRGYVCTGIYDQEYVAYHRAHFANILFVHRDWLRTS